MKSNPVQSKPLPTEADIDPIRVELLSTEMPIHQLAKRGEEEIRILKRKRGGQIQAQWRVDYNLNVGRPGQLAYHLDTWVIKRRLSELHRPISRLVRIGDLRQIARELNHGGDTNAVRLAFDQNAATFVRAKITYRTKEGDEETLEGYFNRYNVFYRGHTLPGGRHAETVYISLNDPYYGLINASVVRPLDFTYLRQLTPAAQRFYELVSPKLYAAIKNGHDSAWILYSDYCQLAVQKRQESRSRMQAQMGAVQRPHRRSGYIVAVDYRSAPAAEGRMDWFIHYAPGPRARAEFRIFNGARMPRRGSKSAQDGLGPHSGTDRAPDRPRARDSSRSEATTASVLAHRFAERRHGRVHASEPTPRHIEWAQAILDALEGDLETAETAIDLAAKEGRANRKGFPAHLSGVLEAGYIERVREVRAHERDLRQRKTERARERDRQARHDEWRKQRVSRRIADLSDEDRCRIVEDRLSAFTRANRYYLQLRAWPPERVRAWAVPRILEAYGREGEPSYEAWCRQHDQPALH